MCKFTHVGVTFRCVYANVMIPRNKQNHARKFLKETNTFLARRGVETPQVKKNALKCFFFRNKVVRTSALTFPSLSDVTAALP